MPAAVLFALFVVAACDDPTSGDLNQGDQSVSYTRQIADILVSQCAGCHNQSDRKGELSLEDVPSMLRGGKRGPALVPRDSGASRLYRLAARVETPHMPPPTARGSRPLTAEELALLKAWIDQGAIDDSSEAVSSSSLVGGGALPPGFRPIFAVDATADGRRVAVARGGFAELYDAESGVLAHRFSLAERLVHSIRVSSDGRFLAAGTDGDVFLWRCPTTVETSLSDDVNEIVAAAFRREPTMLACVDVAKTLRVWSDEEESLETWAELPAAGRLIAISPRGELIAVACDDNIVRVFGRGREVATLYDWGEIQALVFAGDDQVVLSGHGGELAIWTLPPAPEFATAPPVLAARFADPAGALVALDDSRAIAAGGADGVIRVWDIASGRLLRTLSAIGSNQPAAISALSYDAPRRRLWVGLSDGRIIAMDANDGRRERELRACGEPIRVLDHSPDGTRLVSVSSAGGVVVWDLEYGEAIDAFSVRGNGADQQRAQVAAVGFRDEHRAVAACADGLKTWVTEGRWAEWRRLSGHADRVLALDFNRDCTLLAVGAGEPTRSGELTIWETGKALLVRKIDGLHSDSIYGVRFNQDGTKLATGAADKLVKVVDVATGRVLRSLESHSHHVLSVDWNESGTQLVSAGADMVLKFWDVEAGEVSSSTEPLTKELTAVRWARGDGDSPMVAAASGDRAVRFFEAGGAQVLRTFSGASDYIYGVAVTPDRRRLIAGSADGALYVWDGESGQLLRKIQP